MRNYRKLYAEHFGIKWDSEHFDVHHIDGNRENNSIRNLILLPKCLHHRLHLVARNVEYLQPFSVVALARENLTFFGCSAKTDCLRDYIDVLDECRNWGALKASGYTRPSGQKIEEINLSTRFFSIWNG